jgi:putative mycofactocin binding protein MftB
VSYAFQAQGRDLVTETLSDPREHAHDAPPVTLVRNPAVGFRREPFGALAYNFHTRALHLLRSSLVAQVVDDLKEPITATELLQTLREHGLSPRESHQAVASLEQIGVLLRHGNT